MLQGYSNTEGVSAALQDAVERVKTQTEQAQGVCAALQAGAARPTTFPAATTTAANATGRPALPPRTQSTPEWGSEQVCDVRKKIQLNCLPLDQFDANHTRPAFEHRNMLHSPVQIVGDTVSMVGVVLNL